MPYTAPYTETRFYRIQNPLDNRAFDRELESFLGANSDDCLFRNQQAALDAVTAFLASVVAKIQCGDSDPPWINASLAAKEAVCAQLGVPWKEGMPLPPRMSTKITNIRVEVDTHPDERANRDLVYVYVTGDVMVRAILEKRETKTVVVDGQVYSRQGADKIVASVDWMPDVGNTDPHLYQLGVALDHSATRIFG